MQDPETPILAMNISHISQQMRSDDESFLLNEFTPRRLQDSSVQRVQYSGLSTPTPLSHIKALTQLTREGLGEFASGTQVLAEKHAALSSLVHEMARATNAPQVLQKCVEADYALEQLQRCQQSA